MHTEMFVRLCRSLRRQRLAGKHLGGNVASSDHDDDDSMDDDDNDLWGDWALNEAGDFDYGEDDY